MLSIFVFLLTSNIFPSSGQTIVPDHERYSYQTFERKPFTEARNNCLTANTYIAFFTNNEEFQKLTKYSDPFWVGLTDNYDNIDKVTLIDFPLFNLTYKGEWADGEPNFSNESCVIIDPITKKLMDFGCTAHWVRYICMTDLKQDGQWGEWSLWSDCDCVSGNIKRNRSCNNPVPKHQGENCGDSVTGKDFVVSPCPASDCSVTDWSNWSDWSVCEGVCQAGIKTRTRSCGDPLDTIKTKDCVGEEEESTICQLDPCPGCDVGDDPLVRVDIKSRLECESMGYCYNSFKNSGVCFMKKGPTGKRYQRKDGYNMKSRAPFKIINDVSRTICVLKCQNADKCRRVAFELLNEANQTGRCYFIGDSHTSWKAPKHFEVYPRLAL